MILNSPSGGRSSSPDSSAAGSPQFVGRAGSLHGCSESGKTTTTQPATIALCVRDLEVSRRFYAELFGFVDEDGTSFSDAEILMISPLLANGFRPVLLTSRPRSANSSGLILELETTSELIDRYILARLLRAPTSPLITRGRTLITCIQDPDGHRIELRANYNSTTARRTPEPLQPPHQQLPRGRWDRHEADVMHPGSNRTVTACRGLNTQPRAGTQASEGAPGFLGTDC